MIKIIFFDYFGVISSDDYWNLTKENKQLKGKFHKLADDVNLGKLHWQEFEQELSDLTGASPEEINRNYSNQSINREVIGLINKLRKQFRVGLISNASYEFLAPTLESSGLNKILDPIVISSNEGFVKPSTEIYLEALKIVGVEPQEALMIDDIERNLDGAIETGMDVILYRGLDDLIHELEARKLL